MGALKPLSFLLRVRSYRGQWLRLDTPGYPGFQLLSPHPIPVCLPRA